MDLQTLGEAVVVARRAYSHFVDRKSPGEQEVAPLGVHGINGGGFGGWVGCSGRLSFSRQ